MRIDWISLATVFVLASSVDSHAFDWPSPGTVNQGNLEQLISEYSKSVQICLGKDPHALNSAESEWCRTRDSRWDSIFEVIRSVQIEGPLGSLLDKRTAVCEQVKFNFVATRIQSQQFGNSNEGALVFYCLAHEAGYRNLMTCRSENDHAFAVVLDDSKGTPRMCVMDRWDLVGLGNFFCGANIVNGKIEAQNAGTDVRNWYSRVTCEDDFVPITTEGYSSFGAKEWVEWLKKQPASE
jgi:hypothetical protein